MDEYNNKKEVRQRRSKKLCIGKCSICSAEAQIPWKSRKYCYHCWKILWVHIKEELKHEKEKEQKAEEARQKKGEEAIATFLRAR